MSSKAKKGKKKPKSINDVTKSKDTLTNKKIHAYFTNEEITELKSIMKMKDVVGVPFVIAATLLYKLDLMKKLLKDGYNVNQTGQNNMTALLWAIKYKYLDIVDYLLNNGADPTIKTDSGDNVLILALEHKLWDEQSMINLWKSVKKISFIDVNFTNKNGHNMLHMCVRRDWEQLLKLLLTEKPDIDAGNSNGVTPLMLACFRNNITIITILINAGADILKEDNHGRMTLCYAISSCMKVNKPPFLATEKIITELKKKSSLENYLHRRVELIIATAKRSEISCATAEMLIKIVQFAVHYMEEGISIFLGCDIFAQLLEIITSRLDNSAIVKFLLEVCEEILFYNEQCVGYKVELSNKLVEGFYESGLVDIVLEVLRKQNEEAKIAFNVLILGFTNNERWEKNMKKNTDVLLPLLNDYQNINEDENRAKILKNKKRKLKKVFESVDVVSQPSVDTTDKNSEDKKKSDNGVNFSKKSRRRSKAIKARLTKMKSAELTKRLNLNGKKLNQRPSKANLNNKIGSNGEIEFLLKPTDTFESRNPIVTSLRHLLETEIETFEKKKVEQEIHPQWKKEILSMSRIDISKNFPLDQDKLASAVNYLKESTCQKYNLNINRSMNIIIDYLKQLVQLIVRKYREHWENDRISGNCTCLDINEHVPWLFNQHLRNLESREKRMIQELQKNFDQLIKSVKELAHKDVSQCLKALNEIESTILNYEIRGIKMLSYVIGMETFTLKYKTTNPKVDNNFVLKHVQNVVNNHEEARRDIEFEVIDEVDDVSFVESYKSETPIELFFRELSQVGEPDPKNKRKEIEAKLNTIANGFHLINSIMALCDDDLSQQKLYKIADLMYPLRGTYPKPQSYSEISEYMPKRLKSQISSLQNCDSFQKLLGGEIRIATKEQRVNYIISAGVNFTAVELGLDINNQPLAVKRIPRESWVGKMVKTLAESLLGLIDNHVLHYFACEYEGNELILATPLCKWTMGQYIQLLRHSIVCTVPNLTGLQLVKQFLTGLMVLHKCEIPIIHGNLKPSNIFIDFNGLVKIAEFGIHKALYKIIEAPKSSLIWFAKETLEIYKNSSIVDCTLKSDIQVAGMLIYYMLSYGKHPFGCDTDEILKNIQGGILQLNMKNLDMKDLLLWMMSNDINERPNIEQVLAHPFFWSPVQKWSFILCCSGINNTGYILPLNIDKLHRSIDGYANFYIKLEWHDIIATKFPNVVITEYNNVVGLLNFIKNCHDNQEERELTDSELSCAILSLFPTLPVALYRALQNTNWFRHPVFIPFCQLF
ncbi:uncharacterized protein LOC123008358 isoform X2 [Tribolium madens]|uniref:uncharacterized protein LOC123008358 isoform X2 n=1 Tax=Tribolium madens TaxID=41895 RepID=UPI001CF7565C|nr:uncharacterized protein LOC123008358 isoform X2 [Tribolium madens]